MVEKNNPQQEKPYDGGHNQNQSLQSAGAPVIDYGKSRQLANEQKGKTQPDEENTPENTEVSKDEGETLGIP